MHAPYRIAARREPEGPDEADAYEARLRARAARWRRVLVAICGALTLLSVAALMEESPPSRARGRAPALAEARAAARIADARDTIAAARAYVEREQARFTSTLGAVLDSDLTPAPGAHRCSVDLGAGGHLLGRKQPFPLLVVAEGDRDLPSPSVARMLADVNRAEEHLAAGRTMDAILHANALSARMAGTSGRLAHDVVLVTTVMKHPKRTSPTSFEPGEITGRAYVYDFADHRVKCVGDIHATSSSKIEYSFASAASAPAAMDRGRRLSAFLDDDLEQQIRATIDHGELVEVGALR